MKHSLLYIILLNVSAIIYFICYIVGVWYGDADDTLLLLGWTLAMYSTVLEIRDEQKNNLS